MRAVLLAAIGFYQRAISPLTPASCRFHPTCSEYARQAVERFGALRGGVLAVKRVLRCHPFGGRGHDPVPALPAQSVGQLRAQDARDAVARPTMMAGDTTASKGTP